MSDLTISQALRKMAKLKAEVAAWRSRAVASVYHSEESEPAYPFSKCLEEEAAAKQMLIALRSRVALTNATTEVDGKSLAFCLTLLQEMKGTLDWLKTMPVQPQATSVVESRSYDEEGKVFTKKTNFLCHMTERTRDESIASIQAQFDELNDAVETANGRTLLK